LDKTLCLIVDSLVQSEESALCPNFRGHHHLFCQPIFGVLARGEASHQPAIDAATALDGATTLHDPIMARPPSRPRCTMPSGRNVVDVLETNTAPPRNQPALPHDDCWGYTK
jgi:hypothetical protein